MNRGQATTELALGSLVFVTVLVFGVHFGEAGFAMLKAKEAAAHAMHRASGERTHRFSLSNIDSADTYEPFSPASAGTATEARYSAGFRGVFTQVSGARVSCRVDDAVEFEVARPSSGLSADADQALRYLRNRYKNRGGVSCQARARMNLFGVPSSFAEGSNGFFSEPHARFTSIPICGAGMPVNGSCTGKLATLTGDWAFEGDIGSKLNEDVADSRRGRVENKAYERIVRELFDRSGGPYSDSTAETPAQRMLRIGGGMSGGENEWMNETTFSMSYVGERGPSGGTPVVRRHHVAPEYNPNLEYQTVGADMTNPVVRWDETSGEVRGVPRCFMSLYGCARHPSNPRVR